MIDPTAEYDVPNTLTVRINGEDHFFDLHGQDFLLRVESGYFEVIDISKRGRDLLMELDQSGTAGETAITIPMFWLERVEGEAGYLTMAVEKIVIRDKHFEIYIDTKSKIRDDWTGQIEQVYMRDSCLYETYVESMDFFGIALPGAADYRDYAPIWANMSVETRNQETGTIAFSRDILRANAGYQFCFGCDHRICSEALPIR